MKKVVKNKKKNTKKRFRDAVSSRLMLGEPRMVGYFMGNYFQLQYMFGEKAFCIWDFLIHIEAVGYFAKNKDNPEESVLKYKIIRGYWNPFLIFMWFAIPFIPLFMVVSAKGLLSEWLPVKMFVIPAIPIFLRVVVTGICSRVFKKADEGIKQLEEMIDYQVERISMYPESDVRGQFNKLDI